MAKLIVHGGAGGWSDTLDVPKIESIQEALRIGWEILDSGGSALDAVEKAVNWLEDDPLFDAGIGSHLNAEGVVEMDAILIDAETVNFGAVAGVQRVQYPISLARKVLEETDENFFIGAGADALAARLGMPLIPNVKLISEHELGKFRNGEAVNGMDTVGAVALDNAGRLAVATSTGGTPRKPAGRVGDSPLFGAGGYAEKGIGGASATGKGENSMRVLLSRNVVDYIRAGKDAQAAAQQAMRDIDALFEPSMVGVIAIDAQGNPGAAHTTPKMSYGWVDAQGQFQARVKSE